MYQLLILKYTSSFWFSLKIFSFLNQTSKSFNLYIINVNLRFLAKKMKDNI